MSNNENDNKNDIPANATPSTTAPAISDGIEDAPTAEPTLQLTQRQLDDHVNKILSSRVRRLETKFERQLEQALSAARGQPAPSADPDQAAALAALQAMESDRKQQLADAEERERQLLDRELRSEVEHTLSTMNCTNPRGARLVLAEDGRIRRNADGELCFVDDDGSETDVSTGLRKWFTTAEGKNWASPKGGGEGSGTVIRGGASHTFGAPPSKREQRAEAIGVFNSWIHAGRK